MAEDYDFKYKRSGKRFAQPFGSRAWHADGTPFTRDDYVRVGMIPPTEEELEIYEERDKEGKSPKIS